jgi:hypothetical protein
VYRYEQICGVHGDERSRRVAIDYYPLDASGRPDRTHCYTRRLRPAQAYDALLNALRTRAMGTRRVSRQPAVERVGSASGVSIRSVTVIAAAAVFTLGVWESSVFLSVSVALITFAAVLMPEIR